AQRAWPAVSPDEGELTGHVLSDLGTRSLPAPVAPSTGSMVSTRTVAVVGASSLAVVLGGAAVVGLLALGAGAWWWTAQSQAQGEPVALQATVSEPAGTPAVASTEKRPASATPETTATARGVPPGEAMATASTAAVPETVEAPRRASTPAVAAPAVPEPVASEGAAEAVEPAATPPPAPSAHFASAGTVAASLRGSGGQRFAAGALPAGTYTVLANFGGGEVEAGRVQCEAGATCTVRCNALLGTCAPVEAP
ncbi:MAG: hypothetical protein JXX28_12405, partial [Deltaproteobacteria bacterium]|nr:hypothetical protein [Deltaproteobacteria bacterium]